MLLSVLLRSHGLVLEVDDSISHGLAQPLRMRARCVLALSFSVQLSLPDIPAVGKRARSSFLCISCSFLVRGTASSLSAPLALLALSTCRDSIATLRSTLACYPHVLVQ